MDAANAANARPAELRAPPALRPSWWTLLPGMDAANAANAAACRPYTTLIALEVKGAVNPRASRCLF